MDLSQRENYIGKFDDKRLAKRANQLSALLFHSQNSSIHASTVSEAEQKACYRFLSNENVRESALIQACVERSSYLCEGRDVLLLEDSTEINMQDHHRRLKQNTGLGLTGNNVDLGFFLHASLVLDATDETALGFSDIQLWPRETNRTKKDQRHLPIEEKESYRWIKASSVSKEHLSKAASITIVQDREGDIYEQFVRIPDARTHLIIRNRDNRRLADGGKLHDRLAGAPMAGSYSIEIVKDIRKGVESRTAHLEVRFCKVSIARPQPLNKFNLPDKLELYAVEVREVNCAATNPIIWRIMTTHVIENYEDAVSIVKKYRLRWHIEQLFRLIKSKGFQIESSELETGWAIRRLTIMILNSALRVMQLLLAQGNDQSQALTEVFNDEEIECLEQINKKLEAGAGNLINKNDSRRLAWATWIIARLGGWKAVNPKRPPGPILLKKGLDKFNSILEGWKLARDVL
jgi:Transposase DNA-binding/Transposase DDE domain